MKSRSDMIHGPTRASLTLPFRDNTSNQKETCQPCSAADVVKNFLICRANHTAEAMLTAQEQQYVCRLLLLIKPSICSPPD